MTIRIAQFVHAASDVVDEAFLREFPEVEAVKATISNPCPRRSTARKSSMFTIPPSRGVRAAGA